MKREYLFILITIVVAVAGLIYKSMFVADKLNDTQNLIIENNDRYAKFQRDTIVQGNTENIVKLYKDNKRDDRTYGEVIAELLKTTEDILKESKIKYDVNDINQEQENPKNKDWKNKKESFYININFEANYKDLIRLINVIERHKLIINIASMSYSRIRPKRTNNDKNLDEFSDKIPLSVEIRLEYIKFYENGNPEVF